MTTEYGVLEVRHPNVRVDRVPATGELAELVMRYWLVTWELPAGATHEASLLPHPCVNLFFEHGTVAIAGVGRDRFSHTYAGAGRVFGIKFRPGAFRPFLGGPVAELTDQIRPLASLWGAADAERFAADLAAAAGLDDLCAVAERHLRAHWPAPDPQVALVGRIADALLYDRTIARVEDVVTRFGIPTRSLHRLFERYVGVSPKAMLRRYRLHEAAERLAEGTSGTWAEVAIELGYFDQSHFIRDFTRAVGVTPVAYSSAVSQG